MSLITHPPRPVVHFTPPSGWMNDPNGLVYVDGAYHLFYQHNPHTTDWATMHWGHAASRDLLHWQHYPIALTPDEHGAIFSGSVVNDLHNTSGLVPGGGLVALFSYDSQCQGLAYSHDTGLTWTMHPHNPILTTPVGIVDFRDPKVFWDAPRNRWGMVLVAGDHVVFYASRDLVHWTRTGAFGLGVGAHGGVWECPDVFALPRPGLPPLWVLVVSVIAGGPAVGSGTQVFLGHYNGDTFHADAPAVGHAPLWLDWGPDNYAGVTWNDAPHNSRLIIGWMSNWLYARATPATTWRGALTLPRTLHAQPTPDGWRVAQHPWHGLEAAHQQTWAWADVPLSGTHTLLDTACHEALDITMTLDLGRSNEVGLEVLCHADYATRVAYDAVRNQLVLDRTHSSDTDLHPDDAGRYSAPMPTPNGVVQWRVIVDATSVEVFSADGLCVLTAQLFPPAQAGGLRVYAHGGTARLVAARAATLRVPPPQIAVMP